MTQARELLAVFREMNSTSDRCFARFTPSLVGMFGSQKMLDLFLADLETALESKTVTQSLKQRATNLAHTFIPQVAGYNGISDPAAYPVTVDELRLIRPDSPEDKIKGVRAILSAFMRILDEVVRVC